MKTQSHAVPLAARLAHTKNGKVSALVYLLLILLTCKDTEPCGAKKKGKVSALVYLLCKVTIERTVSRICARFQNLCPFPLHRNNDSKF
jgi:hypothetical protein